MSMSSRTEFKKNVLSAIKQIICPNNFIGIADRIFLALIEKEGYVVGEVPKVNNALDEMDSNGIVVSSEHNQALHFLLQSKLYIPSTIYEHLLEADQKIYFDRLACSKNLKSLTIHKSRL
jgi:hypothetical protein